MSAARRVIAREFEAGLDAVYGKFEARETGARSGYAISRDDAHFLRPVRVRSQCLVSTRQANGLNSEWADHFFLMQLVSGQTRIGSDTNTGVLRPNDMVLLDWFSAYEYLTPRRCECVLVPFHFDFVEDCRSLLASCGQRIDGSRGIGRVLAATFSTLSGISETLCSQDRQAMLDAVRILLSRVVEQQRVEIPAGGPDLLARAEQVVLRDLSNPGLNPDTIADALDLSRRQLYRLFAEHGVTPSSWLWGIRLAEAHARLASTAWASVSLTQIAFEVGFNDMAHFSRLYRAQFGRTPREARHALAR